MKGGVEPPPAEMLRAFRAAEVPEQIAVLMIDDGVDALTLRVAAAWLYGKHRWVRPKEPAPDGIRPSAETWEWLVSGWVVDIAAIADGANVTRADATARMHVLITSRLLYPDGSIHASLRVAMKVHVNQRLSGGGKRKRKTPADPTPAGEGETN